MFRSPVVHACGQEEDLIPYIPPGLRVWVHRRLEARKAGGSYPESSQDLSRNKNIMQKPCKENEGKPKSIVPQREEERSYGEFQCQQTEGNFRQRLLQSLEEFKEDIDYRHFKGEEMTREGDEIESTAGVLESPSATTPLSFLESPTLDRHSECLWKVPGHSGQDFMLICTKLQNNNRVIEALSRAKFKFLGHQKMHISKKWNFTKFNTNEFEDMVSEERLSPDGYGVKYIPNHGALDKWQALPA
ncbi:Transcription Elongation Factor A Protein-Like 7 [Manis pentadactyla]|nr:Transcription Elongation Factor A Protein-Like 7 [Manis pentadactyla]